MSLKTLRQLRDSARQRSDNEDDGNFVSDSELNDYVNESVAALYDLMIDGDSETLFAANAPILTQVGVNAYQLPSDFYRMVSIDILDGGTYRPGTIGDVSEWAQLASKPPIAARFKYFIRFNLTTSDRFVYVFPEVDENLLAVVYVPEAPILALDTDTFDGPNQWHEYVTVSCAIKLNTKQEQDITGLEVQRRELAKRITDHVRGINVGTPQQVREIATRHHWGLE